MLRPELSALQAVAAVASCRSFRAAAAELGLSASAVSYAVSGLEERMGVRLFHRTTRSVSLSEAGRAFLARIGPALSEIDGAIDSAMALSSAPTGTLRINTSETAAHQMLGRYVGKYLARYPDMRVDIVTDGRLIDIVANGFDAGVRLGNAVPQSMVAAHFGPEQGFAVLGSPAYFKHHGIPQTPHDLASHRCVRNRLPSGAMWRWEFKRHDEEYALDVDGPLTLDHNLPRREAALAGIGLVYMHAWTVRQEIRSKQLVPVLSDWMPSLGRLALYYPGHRHVPAGLRAFIDTLRDIDAKSP